MVDRRVGSAGRTCSAFAVAGSCLLFEESWKMQLIDICEIPVIQDVAVPGTRRKYTGRVLVAR